MKGHVSDMLDRFGGPSAEHVYPTVRVALQAFQDLPGRTDRPTAADEDGVAPDGGAAEQSSKDDEGSQGDG